MVRTASIIAVMLAATVLPSRSAAPPSAAATPAATFAPVGDFVRDSVLEPKTPFELVPGKSPNDWAFSIEPYLWAMGLNGTTGIGSLPALKVNASAQKLLQNLDWGLMAFGEVRKGRWGLLADGYYAELSGSRSLGGVFYKSGSLNLEQGLASLALAYRIIDDRRVFLDVYAGARYNYLGAQLGLDLDPRGLSHYSDGLSQQMAAKVKSTLAAGLRGDADAIFADVAGKSRELRKLLGSRDLRGRSFDGSRKALRRLIEAQALAARAPTKENLAKVGAARQGLKKALSGGLADALPTEGSLTEWWVDPIVGLRAQANFTRWLYFATQADVGGFGAGSQIAWNVMASLGVNFTRNVYAELGYRYMYLDYDQNGFLYDMNTYGLLASIGFKF